MAGGKTESYKLNNTLIKICKILNKINLSDWFIGYGTLLGIIRNNSCIENDDDIDILCNKNDYDIIKNELGNNGFSFTNKFGIKNSKDILKTCDTSEYCSVDFYMCDVDKNTGNFNDKWERVVWSNCYTENGNLIKKEWNDVILYIPNNYESKLIGRYGEEWRVPMQSKGVKPKKKVL